MTDSTQSSLLIELGCEELPPLALNLLSQTFFNGVCQGLEEAGIAFNRDASTALQSPRRMSMLLQEVASHQPDRTLERKGPAVAAAFDADGEPTRAASGFAQSVGLSVDQLDRLKTDKGEWLYCKVHKTGEPLADLLFPILAKALDQLPVPRPMRWSDHDFSFVRPVHWLVVLHGDTVLPGSLYGCESGRVTRGHRIHAPGPAELATADDYVQTLEDHFVLVDANKRREVIHAQATAVGEGAGGVTRLTDALLNEVNNLVEWPAAVPCAFHERFLDVPAEALIASMEYHQKFFPILDADGQLTPDFVVIANIESQDEAAMREGFERVITPRLADAEFFWQQDLKQTSEQWLEALDAVVFQKDLGSVGDKTRRIAEISKKLADVLGFDAALAEQAGRLAKADLVSQMVGEFPELQGTMGGHYLRAADAPGPVADAVSEHYRPRYSGDDLPASDLGRIIALADRLDTLVGIFAAGLKPTGNKDPFALRRAALGIIRLLEESPASLTVDATFGHAQQALNGQLEVSEEVMADVLGFFRERLRNYLMDTGASTNQVSSVMAAPLISIPDLITRLAAVKEFMAQPEADSLIAANKRIGNILKKQKGELSPTIDPDAFVLDEEKTLFDTVNQCQTAFEALCQEGKYSEALASLSALRAPIDDYFEAVMVMDEDLAVRANRTAQLAAVKQLFDQVADFSQAD